MSRRAEVEIIAELRGRITTPQLYASSNHSSHSLHLFKVLSTLKYAVTTLKGFSIKYIVAYLSYKYLIYDQNEVTMSFTFDHQILINSSFSPREHLSQF